MLVLFSEQLEMQNNKLPVRACLLGRRQAVIGGVNLAQNYSFLHVLTGVRTLEVIHIFQRQ
jgi:hypothetical protein